MTHPGYLALVAVVFMLVAVVPSEAWRNETRVVYTCSFTLTTLYYPAPDREDVPLPYNESNADANFGFYLRQMWADFLASGGVPPFNVLDNNQFVSSQSGTLSPMWVVRTINNITAPRLAEARPVVEGTIEAENDCWTALGLLHNRYSLMATYVAASLEMALYGTNASIGYFSEYNLREQVVSERYYTVLVPTEEDFCSVNFAGSFSVDRQLTNIANDPFQLFRQELAGLGVNLTLFFDQPWFYANLQNRYQLGFYASLRVLKSDSFGLTSLLRPAVERTVERLTNPPYDNSELRINSSLACWQPPPVTGCAQVSAKLESGAPFAINVSATNMTTEHLTETFLIGLITEAETSGKIFNIDIHVDSIAAVPLEEPDTIQVGVRVAYWVNAKDESKAASTIGRYVTAALEAAAVEVVASNLYEVNYTITPCRH